MLGFRASVVPAAMLATAMALPAAAQQPSGAPSGAVTELALPAGYVDECIRGRRSSNHVRFLTREGLEYNAGLVHARPRPNELVAGVAENARSRSRNG